MSEATRHEVKVSLGERSYSILIGRGLLQQAGSILGRLLRQPRVILVIDANLVATDHDVMLRRSLHEAGITVHPVEVAAGEASKSHATYAWLMDEILALGVDRKVTVIAFGGGVIGDLAGFVAASLLRGVDFVQIPTTLLSQVDSSVGGKTGINSRHGKNLIGAFHQPGIVLIDTAVLDSLPERELRSGYAEIIKYGCIIDADFFDWLLSHGADMLDGDPELRARAIRRSVEIKAAIVADDERETSGVRALLNFGHTFAHAYEALAGYNGTLLHGEAVSIGMVKATRLSADLGLASRDDAVRLHDHLATLNLPTSPRQLRNDGFAVDGLLNAMQRDKKAEDGKMQFVLWRGIGNAFVARGVPLNVLRDRLHEDG